MPTKKYILSPLKTGCISLLFILSNNLFATTYYVDAISGNDNNSGTSKIQAWKTLSKINNTSFLPGDVTAFKKGQTFKGSFSVTESGTSKDNIMFTSYGTGALPILGNKVNFSGGWKNKGSNIWTKSGGMDVRAWRNGVEQGKCNHFSNNSTDLSELGVVGDVFFGYSKGVSYLYSKTDPNNDLVELASVNSIIRLIGDYITLDQLDVRYATKCILLTNTKNITIQNSAIGIDSGTGIRTDGINKNLLIENNVFDANFKLHFDGALAHRLASSYSTAQGKIDARGSNDGVGTFSGLEDSIIRYNDFINWTHSAVAFSPSGSNPKRVTNIEIHNNKFTLPNGRYGRAVGWSDDVATYINFHHNLMDGMWTQSQPNGQHCKVEYNWILNQKDSPWKTGGLGKGFSITAVNGGKPRYNSYSHNTFKNSDQVGFNMGGNGKDYVQFNTVHKNLFDSVGGKPYYSRQKNAGMNISVYNYVGSNKFTNNAFMGSTNRVAYDGEGLTIAKFNAKNGHKGNTISGNTTRLTDQGAGDISKHKIGAFNFATEPTIPVVEPTKYGPFRMSQRGLY